MKITALVKQLKRSQRVNVFIDEHYAFSASLTQVADWRLHQGQQLDPEQLSFWRQAAEDYLLYERVEAWALRRPHSQREIEQYLRRILKTSQARDKALKHLRRKGYVDEQRFTAFWVEQRRRHAISKLKLRSELRAKGIGDAQIETALQPGDDSASIRELIAKKKQLPQYRSRRKLMAYLARKGFSYPDILAALGEDDPD